MSSASPADAAGPDRDDHPRLLPLRAGRKTTLVALLAPLIEAARGDRGHPAVTVTCDVDQTLTIDGDADLLRRALATLLRRAVDAALVADEGSEAPPLREVVVTAVRTAAAVEIEVADSGPAIARVSGRPPVQHSRDGLVADADALVARFGGTLAVDSCPEGGTAVTLRLPHRRARGMAA